MRQLNVVADTHLGSQLGSQLVTDLAAEEQDPDEAALNQAVFSFCISSLEQKIYRRVYDSPLLHFTCVLAIWLGLGLWILAYSFTCSLAGLLWCSRVLMLEDLFAPYDGVRSEGDGGDVGLADYHDDRNDDGGSGGVDEGRDGSGGVDEGCDASDTDEEVAGEVVERFT